MVKNKYRRTSQSGQKIVKIRYFTLAMLFALGATSLTWQYEAIAISSCDDVKFIFARGSGEKLNDVSANAWQESIRQVLGATELKYGFYELGSQVQLGYKYPAVSVSDNFDGYLNLAGAFISGGDAFEFGKSVEQGRGELKAYLAQTAARCPNTRFVLGGYSQGAMVLSRTLPELDASRILYVATFGDPKIYLPEGNDKLFGVIPKTPDACSGKAFSPYRVNVSDCRAYEGVLGSYRPYQPKNYAGKIGVWCNGKDIMCSSGMAISDHTSYVSAKLYQEAAAKIRDILKRSFGDKIQTPTSVVSSPQEVVFLIDSTGSMQKTIDKYVAEAKNLASQVRAGGGHISLFSYGDLKLGEATRKLCDFSCTLDEFSNKLHDIQPHGGGDDPESALSAMLTAMNALAWINGATKSLVLLTDATYHESDYDGTTLDDVVQRSLEIDPVNVYTITTRQNLNFYQALASGTNGKVFNIDTGVSASTTEILQRPTARLALSEYRGKTGTEFTFDASSSADSNSEALSYEWDLDGDGVFETAGSAIMDATYSQEMDCYIQVRVKSPTGLSSTMSAKLVVKSDSNESALTTISELKSTKLSANSSQISFTTNARYVLVTLNDATLGLVKISNQKTAFTLGDLEENARLILTPYSADGQRGISASIVVSGLNGADGLGATQPGDLTNSAIIPKAPNAGYVSKS